MKVKVEKKIGPSPKRKFKKKRKRKKRRKLIDEKPKKS
jgi:hypothetical protein